MRLRRRQLTAVGQRQLWALMGRYPAMVVQLPSAYRCALLISCRTGRGLLRDMGMYALHSCLTAHRCLTAAHWGFEVLHRNACEQCTA